MKRVAELYIYATIITVERTNTDWSAFHYYLVFEKTNFDESLSTRVIDWSVLRPLPMKLRESIT